MKTKNHCAYVLQRKAKPGNFTGKLETIKSDRASLKKNQIEILQIKTIIDKTKILGKHKELRIRCRTKYGTTVSPHQQISAAVVFAAKIICLILLVVTDSWCTVTAT